MENTTHQIRFIILNDENEVLKNFILTERKYNTCEEAAEAAQTVCCVLMNHCGWNVFYRVVKPAEAGGGTFHDDGEDHIVPDEDEEEYEEEEENCTDNELDDKIINEFLAWMCQG